MSSNIINKSNQWSKRDIEKMLIPNIETETPKRKWERRLLVALTKEEVQKCKAKIKEYSRN